MCAAAVSNSTRLVFSGLEVSAAGMGYIQRSIFITPSQYQGVAWPWWGADAAPYISHSLYARNNVTSVDNDKDKLKTYKSSLLFFLE